MQNSRFRILILFTFVFSLFIGCEDQNSISTDREQIDLNKINTVLLIKNVEEQKIAYGLLNSSEKYYIWNSRIENAIKDKKIVLKNKGQSKIVSTQISLLETSKNDLIKPLFIDKDREEYLKNISIPQFESKMKENFSEEEIYYLFYTLSSDVNALQAKYLDEDEDEDDDDNGGGGSGNDCECNVGSSVSCSLFSDRCEENDECQIVSSKCGFFWMYDCNGMCRF